MRWHRLSVLIAPLLADGEPPAHITVRGLSKQFQGDVIYDSFNLDIPLAA